MLYSNEMDLIIGTHLTGNTEWEKREVPVHISFIEMNVIYFYNKNKNFIIIPSPLAVKQGSGDAAEPSYQTTVDAIKNQIGIRNFGIGCSLLGKGAGERHYTALFKEIGDEGKVTVFDSKISSPKQFFNSSDAPGFFEKIWGLFNAPFKAFGLWAFEIGKEIQSSFLGNDVAVYRLATQPIFDGVSCGFHSAGAVLNMIDLIDANNVTPKEIIHSITNDKNLDTQAETILNAKKEEVIPGVNPILGSLVSKEGNKIDNDHLDNLDLYEEHHENETTTIENEDVVSTVIRNDEFDNGSLHQP